LSDCPLAARAAAARHEVRDAVANVYRALQDAIDLRRPRCSTSGRCCRFDEFGHRLFVTTMEMGSFLHDVGLLPQSIDRECPFQSGTLCSVHSVRPFGCRVFFCDETSVDWQRQQYEFFHSELKRLHECLGVAYYYVEWRQALSAVASLQPVPT
jgi:Fe-S-cluster containining protein